MICRVSSTNIDYKLDSDLITWIPVKYPSDYDNYLTANANVCSRYYQEKYTHSSYIARVGDYIYTTYMYNDTNTVEGEAGQGIRMSKQHIINKSDITYFEPAVGGVTTVQDGTILSVGQFFNPIIWAISDTQLRIFFRGYLYGEVCQLYIDFNPSTSTFSSYATRCTMYKGGDFATPYPMTEANLFSHVDWFFGITNYLNTTQGFFMTTNIYKNGSYLYSMLSVGNSSTGGLMTSILCRSSDNGNRWSLYTVLDCSVS